jgi:hypothetical protein
MKHCLLVLVAVVALAFGVPASAQYMYLDVNGDGLSTSADVLTSATTSVDVYMDTNSNGNGSVATCPTGEALTINSYTFILRSTGGVTYGTWTDNMGFTVNLGGATAGNDYWTGRGSGTALAPGTYKLGTLAITVTGNPVINIMSSTSIDPVALTSFGSACPGQDFDNTMKLGLDWMDVTGTYPSTPVSKTTWGKIKDLYR